MKNSFFSLLALLALTVSLVSCGSPSNVLDKVEVKTVVVDEDVQLSFSANLNLGAMSFANISLPIVHPDTQTAIGSVSLTSQLGGVNKLGVTLNVSEIADVQAQESRLPNGSLIPLIGNNQTITVDIGSGAKVYLTVGTSVVALGVAVPIKEFDSIGSTLPGLNVFPVVNKNGFIGTAGVFTGLKSGTSGIAVVADISKAIGSADIFGAQYGVLAQEAQDEFVQLDFRSKQVSSSNKSKLDSLLFKLSNKKTKLTVH